MKPKDFTAGLVVLFIALIGVAFWLQNREKEPKAPASVPTPNPRTELGTTIAAAAGLLDHNDVVTYMKEFLAPETIKSVQREMTVEQIAGMMKDGGVAPEWAAILHTVEKQKPVMSDGGNSADFPMTDRTGRKVDVLMKKENGIWYILQIQPDRSAGAGRTGGGAGGSR